jgi:hypothetical protein
MKRKFIVIAMLVLLVQANSFAQRETKPTLAMGLPLVVEEGIYSLVVSNNIDVVLIQEGPDNVKVKATDAVISKLKVSYSEGRLFLDAAKNVKKDERLVVYVWVNDLENLTLKGDSYAISQGILQGRDLHISLSKDASVSLKSKSNVWFDEPTNHQVLKQKGYFMVTSL